MPEQSFDLHALDKLEPGTTEAEEGLVQYQDALTAQFLDSPEGQTRLEQDPYAGHWVMNFIEYGYNYAGVTIPKMTPDHVDEIVTEWLPKKVTIGSPDDADTVIPELRAFWQFLDRTYRLRRAAAILDYLQEVEPNYHQIMNDPARFGMAKSFAMAGRAAGFDMTNEEDMNTFMLLHNASVFAESEGLIDPDLVPPWEPDFSAGAGLVRRSSTTDSKKKKRRKMTQRSRRKNRK